MSTNPLVLVSRETRTVLTASFLKTPKLRKWSIDQGNLRSETAQMHRLDERRQMTIAEYCEKIGQHELQAAHAEEERRILLEELCKRNFVKFINKILQRWRNYENSKVLHSIRSQDGSKSRTRTLFWELLGRVQKLQNEANSMHDSKDFQDAQSVRSGNSHVTSRPMSFPTHPIPVGMLMPSFISLRR